MPTPAATTKPPNPPRKRPNSLFPMSQHLLPIVGPDAPEATQSIITIQKAKLKEYQLFAEFSEQRDAESPARAFTMQGTDVVHPDLSRALGRLVPHLCLLCEQLAETEDYWQAATSGDELPELFSLFTVTGLSMGKQQGGVTLIGQRKLTGDKVLNLTSPYVSFDDEQEAAYRYAGRLETAVLDALDEVEAALRGKCSIRQLDLFEPQEQLSEFGQLVQLG